MPLDHHDRDIARDGAKARFLIAYRECGIMQPACEEADVHRRTILYWRDLDEDFDQACRDAKQDAVDRAEKELRDRATGLREVPVLFKGEPIWRKDPLTDSILLDDDFNPIPFTTPVFSDKLLELYMKANKPEYRDKTAMELTGADGGPLRTKMVIEFVDAEDGRPKGEPDPLED